MNLLKLYLSILGIVIASGCAVVSRKSVSVTSSSSFGGDRPKKFVVLPGPGITPASDFDNVSNILVFALIEKGYILATFDDAEIFIGVDYRKSAVTNQKTSVEPVYGSVPGPVSLINLSSVPRRGTTNAIKTTGTIINIPQTGVVGQETVTETVTTTTISASVGAYDGAQFRRYVSSAGNPVPSVLWRVDSSALVSDSEHPSVIAGDLMRATAAYAGKGTGGRLDLDVARTRLGSPDHR